MSSMVGDGDDKDVDDEQDDEEEDDVDDDDDDVGDDADDDADDDAEDDAEDDDDDAEDMMCLIRGSRNSARKRMRRGNRTQWVRSEKRKR